MTNQIIAYKKVNDTIISCENKQQLETAKILVRNFNMLFGNNALGSVLDILLTRKEYLIEMNTRPVVYFLVGPPGVGKSTYLNNTLLPSGDYYVASTDNIIESRGKELGMNYTEAFNHFKDVFKSVIEKSFIQGIMQAINERQDVIVDRTNMTDKGRYKILRLFPADYLKIAIVFNFSDMEKLQNQLKKREKEEGKVISDSIVYKMIKSYVEPTVREFDQVIKL